MHEAAVASSILDILSRRLLEMPQACSMDSVTVKIGELRAVDPESLSFAFDSLKDDYPCLKQCRLLVEPVRAAALCAGGGHCFQPVCDKAFACGECGAGIGKLLSGEELYIAGFTVV